MDMLFILCVVIGLLSFIGYSFIMLAYETTIVRDIIERVKETKKKFDKWNKTL